MMAVTWLDIDSCMMPSVKIGTVLSNATALTVRRPRLSTFDIAS